MLPIKYLNNANRFDYFPLNIFKNIETFISGDI